MRTDKHDGGIIPGVVCADCKKAIRSWWTGDHSRCERVYVEGREQLKIESESEHK